MKSIDVIFFDTPQEKKTNIENWVSPPPKKVTRNKKIFFQTFQRLGCLAAVGEKPWSQAQGQRASWAKHLSWTYGILGKELVEEGRSRLRRFRQYVRRPGSWMMPSWKEVIMISDAGEFSWWNGWLTNSGQKKQEYPLGVKNLGKWNGDFSQLHPE